MTKKEENGFLQTSFSTLRKVSGSLGTLSTIDQRRVFVYECFTALCVPY